MKIISMVTGVSLLLIVGVVCPVSGASSAIDSSLRGPLFSNPEESMKLENPDWPQQKITYPKKIGSPDLFISLDQHFYPAAKPLIAAYAKQHNLYIVLQEGTCGTSSGLVAGRNVDIAGYCCPPASSDRLPGLLFHTIGIIPNVLISHHDNPIENITHSEAQKLFSGDIASWGELSDKKAVTYKYNVNPITRLHCKIRPGHWRALLDNEDQFSPMIHNVSSIPDMKDNVAADPHSIGFVARWLLTEKELQRLKMFNLNNVHPDEPGAVAQGRYPLYNVLNITTWSGAAASQTAEKLVQYLLASQEKYDPKMFIIPVKKLKAAGWQFKGNELIGEPGS